MSIQSQRVIFSDNGTLSDISTSVNDFRSNAAVLPIVAAEDYIYIGSELPFNHRYIDVSVANDQASVLSVETWFGNAWTAAVDEIDRTASSGKSLAQDGLVQWSTDIQKGWDPEAESEDVTGLETTAIYHMYWLRLSFSADLNALTAINYIGHKFADDDDLHSYYPDLNDSSILTAFEGGKTDWEEQHFVSAETLIRDLKRRGIIKSSSQILDPEMFLEASIHKLAEIIYGAMGQGYVEQKELARKSYNEALDKRYYRMDKDKDGNLTPVERGLQIGFMRR